MGKLRIYDPTASNDVETPHRHKGSDEHDDISLALGGRRPFGIITAEGDRIPPSRRDDINLRSIIRILLRPFTKGNPEDVR